MEEISETIGISSLMSRLQQVCRSITDTISSLQKQKQLCVVAPKSTPVEDKSPHPDYLVAGCALTSPTRLCLLAKSQIPLVRGRVAENPNCPAAVLSWLAKDSNPEVRLNVAYNPNVPAKVLEWLSEDECPDVLFALAEDHNLATPLLLKLSGNNNPYVAQRAKQTLERLSPLRINARMRLID